MKADPQTEAAVLGTWAALQGMAATGDVEAMRPFVLPDPDALAIGTGADEIAWGTDEIIAMLLQQAEQAEGVDFTLDSVSVSSAGSVAWMASAFTLRWSVDGEQFVMPGRGTGVFEQRDGRWYVAQAHLSVPEPALAPGQFFPSSLESVALSVQADRPDLSASLPEGTVTILFCDIEGSTELNVGLGDVRFVELLREHNEIVRDATRQHAGHEVKSEGDGFMLAFGSARDALQCAIDVQRSLSERNEHTDVPIRVRVGMHTGEPIREASDFFGTHVVMAARIASLASGGEILISSLMHELVASSGEFTLEKRTPVALKGHDGEHVTYSVGWD